jgi:hypothetical protein
MKKILLLSIIFAIVSNIIVGYTMILLGIPFDIRIPLTFIFGMVIGFINATIVVPALERYFKI